MNFMKLLSPAILIYLLLSGCNSGQTTIKEIVSENDHSITSELKVFYDINTLAEYADNTISAQVSSYDTTGGNDDGFGGVYSFLRKNADGSLVIFDQKGGGVINRIWTPTPTQDTLDFYIDDIRKPAFSIRFIDLFSGVQYPFIYPLCGNQLGGYYCYMPIPFKKSCMIVSRGKKIQFHQIQYRMYKNGSKIKSFNTDPDPEVKEAVGKIAALWNNEDRNVNDFYAGQISESSEQFKINPGNTKTIFNNSKGGRILGIGLGPLDAFQGLSKSIDIKVTWDEETNPAIYCPAADFFGYAFGSPAMQSLLIGSRNDMNYCYFPMPFDRSAKIELIYRGSENKSQNPVNIISHIWYSAEKRNSMKEGKFYASWNSDVKPKSGHPHVFANIQGKGHYVGTILQAQGLQPGMTYFFEGDDSTSIDNQFRMHGTGSEDYFNGGWYAMMDRWDQKMSLPLHGSLGYSLPFCRTGGYRFFLSDKMSFEKSIFHSIEHGPTGNRFPVDYTSIALYYSDSPVSEITEPSEALSKVYIPDTMMIYPQLMDYNIFGNLNVKTSWEYGTGGESYFFTPTNDSWLRILLSEIPSGKYSMSFDIQKEPAGCDFSVWQRQKQISGWLSSYSSKEERAGNIFISDISIPETEKSITIRFKTDCKKNCLLLHRIMLVRK
jgi:hypothetical protein